MVGSRTVRRSEVATYVRMAGFEGVTRGERAAGRPGEPLSLCLSALVMVGG